LNKSEKEKKHIEDCREIYLSSLYLRVKLLIKSKWYLAKEKKILSDYPKTLEPVLLPFSPFDITDHPLYQWADIIHLHWVSRFLDFTSFFKKNKKPIVWTLHDKAPFTGGPHCTTFFPFEAYQSLIDHNTQLIKEALKGSKIVVVSPSSKYQELSQCSELLKSFPHQTIFHGIDSEVFRPLDKQFAQQFWDIPLGKKVLLFIVSEYNRPLKGMNLLHEALVQLQRQDIFLLTVGKDFPSDLGVPSKNLGLIRDDRLMALAYAAADIFVSPSLEESFGLTIAEALCCGRAVVCFGVGAATEMMQQGTGVICDEMNVQALKRGMEEALSQEYNPVTIAAISQKTLDTGRQTNLYRVLYEEIMNA
jgi:glycosyltransferase involved in cell wall biosynthesis